MIEANDYQAGNTNLVIVGAQIAGSDEGIIGTAINFNGALGAAGASSGTQPFFTDVSDAPFKISNIGFVTTTTTNQTAHLTFDATIQDGDGDTIHQAITADVTAAANSSTPITLGAAVTTVTPVVLDLNGDGVQFLSQSAGVTYDYNGDGVREATAWASKEDGILVHDANHNGTVDNASEFVFGSATQTDLQALEVYDTNHDGLLSAADADFASFAVWQDANSNGIVDAGEMKSLTAAGIASISLATDGVTYVAADGQVEVAGTGSYTTVTGTTETLADASFATATVTPITTTTTTTTMLAKIAVLVLIIVFIQKRPQGIFAMKGRSAEA